MKSITGVSRMFHLNQIVGRKTFDRFAVGPSVAEGDDTSAQQSNGKAVKFLLTIDKMRHFLHKTRFLYKIGLIID